MAEVKIARGTQSLYNGLQSKDNDTLYYITDTGNIYLGSTPLFESNAIVAASASGKTITFTKHGSVGTTTTVTLSLSDIPTTAEMTSAISSAVTSLYKFKGSCTYEELPQSGNVVGDVWDVTNEHERDGYVYPPGTNYAWDGTSWDPLAGKFTQEQADWNDNDSTSVSYVKNRTHYIDKVGITYPSVSITLSVSGGYARGSMYGYGQYPEGFWDEVKEGRYLKLTVGDFVFEGEVKSNLSSGFYIGNGYIHQPNLPDTGEDWCYYCDSAGFDSFHLMCDESNAGTYSASVFPNEHVYVPLDERFVPDSITRNSELKNASVAYAHDITPNEGDAIVDNTPFVWQTSGGDVSIAPSSTGIIKKILGNNTLSYIEDNKIVPFTGTHIVSRGTNLFNYQDETKRIVGKKLNSDGSITADSSYTLFFVNVLAGVNGGNNGYVPVVKDGETLSGIGFEYLGFQIPQPTDETTNVTLLTRSTHGNASSYLPSDNGWIVFSLLTEKQDCLSMQFVWSYSESQFEFVEYEESVLNLPSVCESGLYGIGSVCDEINNNGGGQYIKRIGVVNTSTLTWESWTESVYDIGTQQYIDVFQGYKTSSLASVIAKSTENITHDYLYQLSNAHTDAEGVLYFTADSEDVDILAQLTNGVNLMYELATYETSSVAFSGLINVWDFGDTRIFGATIWNENVYGSVTYLNPYALTFLYSVNLRDVLRSVANSGVTFSSNGVFTSGLFFGQQIVTKNLNGSSSWTFSELKTMMRVVLNGATNTVTLPQGGNNPFRFQIIVVQDATGGRNLSFSVADSGTIYNPSEFDFTGGTADQLCICTMIWTGNEYIYECTPYVGA